MKAKKKPHMSAAQLARQVELNTLVRTAALTLDPLARLAPLAAKAGLTNPGIRAAIRRGYFTAGQAWSLEQAVGKDLLPKEKLCPRIYAKLAN